MSCNFAAQNTHVRQTLRRLGQHSPQVMGPFQQMNGHTHQAGALDVKTKDLIALGMAIASRCSYCIGFHVRP